MFQQQETYFKMAPTLVSKMVLQSSISLCVWVCVCACQTAHLGHYGLVQISPARGPDTYQIMYGETFSVRGTTHYFCLEHNFLANACKFTRDLGYFVKSIKVIFYLHTKIIIFEKIKKKNILCHFAFKISQKR